MATSRREFLKAGAAAGVMAALGRAAAPPAGRRPNILFVFTDDHASQAIGAYGSRVNRTPHIDRIGREGAVFENCFCTNSICGPSRATVLTGTFSHVNGFLRNGNRFDGSQITYPKVLQAAGYQTAMFGKWHLSSDPTGFDTWTILPGQGSYYNPDVLSAEGRRRIEGYTTDIITDLSLDWLRNGRDPQRPFLLHCWHKAPHRSWMPGPRHLHDFTGDTLWEPPTLFDDYSGRTSSAARQAMTIANHMNLPTDLKVTPPLMTSDQLRGEYGRMTPAQKQAWDEAYAAENRAFEQQALTGEDLVRWKYQRYMKDYLRCIASVDDSVGRLLEGLDESGLAEDTLVIYSSDQGFYLGEHGWFDKRWMYEESLRMPLLLRWPGRVPSGVRVSNMVQNIDFGPTLLAAAGTPVPGRMQGADMLPLTRGRTEGWRSSVYYHYYEFPGAHSVQKHCGVRTERYKLIHFYPVDEWELFDLREDPREMRSVYGAPEYAAVTAELKAEMTRLQQRYGDDTVAAPGQMQGDPRALGFDHWQNLRGIRKTEYGLLIQGDPDTDGASVLRRAQLTRPPGAGVVLRGRLRRRVTEGISNGFLAAAPAERPGDVLRGGVYIRSGQYLIQAGGTTIASKPATFAPEQEFRVALSIDLQARRVTLDVNGETLSADLPETFRAVGYVGYGLNRTTTEFSDLAVEEL